HGDRAESGPTLEHLRCAEDASVEMIRCPDAREPGVNRGAHAVTDLGPRRVERVEPEIDLHSRHYDSADGLNSRGRVPGSDVADLFDTELACAGIARRVLRAGRAGMATCSPVSTR